MHRKQRTIVVSLMAVWLVAGAAFGASGDKAKAKGMIIARTGETLIVKTSDGQVTLVLDDSTQTKDDKGLFGLDKLQMSSTVLIPGQKLEVDGVSDDQGRIVAKTITIDGDDLETAQMIQAGLHPTAQQVMANEQNLEVHKKHIAANADKIAANKGSITTNKQSIAANKQGIETNQQSIATHQQKIEENIKGIEENTNRFNQLSEFDTKAQVTVKFKTGSSKISVPDLIALKKMAITASSLKGYIVEVKGYADASGNAATNQELSEDRAKAVVAYLIQQCGVPVRHVVAPGAMGTYQPAASNETKSGRAENRRVEVVVLVNKGVAGS